MGRFILSAVLMVMMACAANDAFAGNIGFETGDTSGWAETYPQWDGKIDVVTGWSGQSATYRPVRGKYFAVLETGPGDYTTLSQAFNLNSGDGFEGWAAFCCGEEVYYPYEGDNGSYNDYARIRILDSYGGVVGAPWYADSYDIGYKVTIAEGVWNGDVVSFGPLPWKHWTWTAHSPGLYALTYQVTHGGDGEGNSYALFDGPTNNTVVPEASVTAMLVMCFVGIITFNIAGRVRLSSGPRGMRRA